MTSETFGIRELKLYQTVAIVQFLQKQIDMFVNLLTGCGKSLIYQALQFVFDSIFEAAGHVVVASPLLNLMKDRLTSWQILGFLPLLLMISVKKMQGV